MFYAILPYSSQKIELLFLREISIYYRSLKEVENTLNIIKIDQGPFYAAEQKPRDKFRGRVAVLILITLLRASFEQRKNI
jgi:hypothetical protein